MADTLAIIGRVLGAVAEDKQMKRQFEAYLKNLEAERASRKDIAEIAAGTRRAELTTQQNIAFKAFEVQGEEIHSRADLEKYLADKVAETDKYKTDAQKETALAGYFTELLGKDIDASSVLQAALATAGSNERVARITGAYNLAVSKVGALGDLGKTELVLTYGDLKDLRDKVSQVEELKFMLPVIESLVNAAISTPGNQVKLTGTDATQVQNIISQLPKEMRNMPLQGSSPDYKAMIMSITADETGEPPKPEPAGYPNLPQQASGIPTAISGRGLPLTQQPIQVANQMGLVPYFRAFGQQAKDPVADPMRNMFAGNWSFFSENDDDMDNWFEINAPQMLPALHAFRGTIKQFTGQSDLDSLGRLGLLPSGANRGYGSPIGPGIK